MEYEINFLVLQSNTESIESIRQKVKKIIEAHQGTVIDTLEYKKRKLAYKINHELFGFYTVFRFKMDAPAEIEAMKKELNLFSDVARYIIVRTDELPKLQKEIEAPKKEKPVPIKEKKVIKQEDVEKLLAEKKTDSTPEQKTATKEVPEEKPVKEEVEKKAPAEKKEKKDEDSLEDLDKKLDEILNI